MTGPVSPHGAAAVAPVAKVDPSLRKAAEGFEAVMLRQMLGAMRKAKLAEGMFASSATDSFREMADARTADSVAKLGQFGIARLVEKQLQHTDGKMP